MSDIDANAPRLILAADVGGTKTLLQLRRMDEKSPPPGLPVAEQRYHSGAYDSLESMVLTFIEESGLGLPQSACFAVAGPVRQVGDEQQSHLTNLPWQLDTRQLKQTLGITHIHLLNDFQAIGYSLDVLAPDELVALNSTRAQPEGPRLIVGAGTGLGVCLVFPDHGEPVSYPSEGGHLAFAPRDAEQIDLLQFLLAEHDRVSYERLISGAGLVNIYRFLRRKTPQADDPLLAVDDPAAAIGEHGTSQPHSTAGAAVSLFAKLYGAFTGDMALACLPVSGIYIAGGIAPKLLSHLQDGGFMQAFNDKGRMHGLTASLSVQVITNPQCGLLGAARYAARF